MQWNYTKLLDNVRTATVVIVYSVGIFVVSLDHCWQDLQHLSTVRLDDEQLFHSNGKDGDYLDSDIFFSMNATFSCVHF